MEYKELKKLFSDYESSCPKDHLTGYITFSSFGPENHNDYNWESRTYSISSDNKAFQPNMGGYSIFGSCLDGTDCCLRLERFMVEEHGGKGGWVVEDCCVVGYLLIESADMSISTPQMFYSADEARDKMLSLMADYAEIDVELLKADYARSNSRLVTDHYSAEKFNAWAGIGAEGKLWEIKPVYIHNMLDIRFDHA